MTLEEVQNFMNAAGGGSATEKQAALSRMGVSPDVLGQALGITAQQAVTNMSIAENEVPTSNPFNNLAAVEAQNRIIHPNLYQSNVLNEQSASFLNNLMQTLGQDVFDKTSLGQAMSDPRRVESVVNQLNKGVASPQGLAGIGNLLYVASAANLTAEEKAKVKLASEQIASQAMMQQYAGDTSASAPSNIVYRDPTTGVGIGVTTTGNSLNQIHYYAPNSTQRIGVSTSNPSDFTANALKFGMDLSAVGALGAALDQQGIQYKPYEQYAGTMSDAGIDFADIASGGLGNASNWASGANFVEPIGGWTAAKKNQFLAGTGVETQYSDTAAYNQYIAQQAGLNANPSVTSNLGFDDQRASATSLVDGNGNLATYAVRDGVEQDSKGNWVEKWTIKDMFADTEVDGVLVTKTEQEAKYLADKAKALVPTSVTPRQARIALLRAGMLDTVNQAVASNAEWAITWEFATEVKRDDPMIAAVQELLGKTELEIDQLFIDASKL